MVACTESNAADVIDLATRKSLRRMPLGDEPEAFDLSPDGKTLYVSQRGRRRRSASSTPPAARCCKTVKVGKEPEGVKVSRRRQDACT